VARRWHQVSNVGKILDPVADRVLVISGLLAVAAAAGVPWWFALTTLTRELIVSILTLVLASLGAARIDVLWWGKVSTFALMTSFPLFLLTTILITPHCSHGNMMCAMPVGDWNHGTDTFVDRTRRLRQTGAASASHGTPSSPNLVSLPHADSDRPSIFQ